MSMNFKLRAARRATVVTAGAFALALAAAACGGNSDTPEGAVENFLDNGAEDLVNAMFEGDADKAGETAEKYFCDEDVTSVKETAGMFADLSDEEKDSAKEMAGDAFSQIQDMEYEIGDVTEDGDKATVEVSMTVDGETTEESVDVVKDGDEWKICGWMA